MARFTRAALTSAPWAEHVLDLRPHGTPLLAVAGPAHPTDWHEGHPAGALGDQVTDGTGWSLHLWTVTVGDPSPVGRDARGRRLNLVEIEWYAVIGAPDGIRTAFVWHLPALTQSESLATALASPLGIPFEGAEFTDGDRWTVLRTLHHALRRPHAWAGVPTGADIPEEDLRLLLAWAPHGIDAHVARHYAAARSRIHTGYDLAYWRARGLSEAFITAWTPVTFDPDLALRWAAAEVSPRAAAAWFRYQHPLAVTLHQCGWSPKGDTVRDFREAAADFTDRLRLDGDAADAAVATLVSAAHRAGLAADDTVSLLSQARSAGRISSLADLAVQANLTYADARALLYSQIDPLEARAAHSDGALDFDALRVMTALR